MKKKMENQFICSKMMLPEHKDAVERLIKEDAKIEKPSFDEQRLEEFDVLLKRSLYKNAVVEISFLNSSGPCAVVGVVNKVVWGVIFVEAEKGVQKIFFDRLLNIQEAFPGKAQDSPKKEQ